MPSTAKVIEIEAGIDCEAEARAAKGRRVKIVEIATGQEHELPGDVATRDARTLAYFSYPSGAVLPLVMRPPEVAFYLCGDRWPDLAAKLVRRSA
jgi:hypothetical protein